MAGRGDAHLRGGQVEQCGGGVVGGEEEGAPADGTDGLLQQVGGQGGAAGGQVD